MTTADLDREQRIERGRLRGELDRMNDNLADLGAAPLVSHESAYGLDNPQLRRAITITAEHLIAVARAVNESS